MGNPGNKFALKVLIAMGLIGGNAIALVSAIHWLLVPMAIVCVAAPWLARWLVEEPYGTNG